MHDLIRCPVALMLLEGFMHGLGDRLLVWDTQDGPWQPTELLGRQLWEAVAVSCWLKLNSELSKSCCLSERQNTSHQPARCGTLLPWGAGLPDSRQVSFLRRQKLFTSRPATALLILNFRSAFPISLLIPPHLDLPSCFSAKKKTKKNLKHVHFVEF